MPVRLGISPIGWSNDDLPELGGDIPLENCLAEARRAGFSGIELGNKFPRDAAILRPILDRHELSLVSGWYSGRLLERAVAEELAAIEPHRALLAAMGCAVLVYAETTGGIATDRRRSLSSRPWLRDSEWPEFGGKLTDLADALASTDIRLAYHHHIGTVVETATEIDRLMEASGDSVGLLLDTGHLVFAGANPAAIARRYARRICHVHCKDVRAEVLRRVRFRDASFLDAVLDGVFTVPGDGCIDFAEVLAPLATAGYDGWMVVEAEQDPAQAPPLEYAQLGYAHLAAVVRRAWTTAEG
jgi:inosose dehydratase